MDETISHKLTQNQRWRLYSVLFLLKLSQFLFVLCGHFIVGFKDYENGEAPLMGLYPHAKFDYRATVYMNLSLMLNFTIVLINHSISFSLSLSHRNEFTLVVSCLHY